MSSKYLKLPNGRKIELPTEEEDTAINAGIAADTQARELDDAWFAQAKPATEVLPPAVQAALGIKVRGAQKAPTKQATTIRLSPDVMAAFKATGAGWQTRIDNALKDWLKTHSPA